jgi:hypothetical protein
MTRITWLKLGLSMAALCLMGLSGLASRQSNHSHSLACDDQWSDSNKAQHCEMRETTVPAGGVLSVDGQRNGGISIKGADRSDVLVRARVQSRANTDAEAQAITTQIKVETGGQRIYASGPEMAGDRNWSVSYEILVPRQSDLSLNAHNGGISISDVRGQINFTTQNGGV